MNGKKLSLSLLWVTILAVLLQACAGSQPQKPSELPDLGLIKIGYLPTISFIPWFLASEKGYFAEQGLTVEMVPFDSGSKTIAPLSTGQLDVGAGEPGTAMFNAVYKGLDINVVCDLGKQAEGHGSVPILVRKDLFESGEVTKPEDLKGRKLAINVPRGMAEYTYFEALKLGGLTLEDVEMVELSFPDMPPALANKAVDLVMIPYPLAAKAITGGDAVVFLEGEKIAGEIQTSVMYFGKRLLDPANKEVAVRVLMVYLKAVRELQSEDWKTDQNLALVQKYTNLTPEVIKTSILPYQDPNCQPNLESLEKVQAFYVSRGYTDYSEPLPLTKVFDDSIKKEAVSRLGETK